MHQIIIVLLFILIAAGIGVLIPLIRFLFRYKSKIIKLKPKKLVRFFSVFLFTIILTFGSIYWLLDCYFLERSIHYFSIEKAMYEYGGIKNYEIVDRIDPEFTLDKILLVRENDDVLVACYIKTRKMLIGVEKYYANGGVYLISSRVYGSKLIGENYVNGGKLLDFPNVWYGIIYPENRNKIQINGKIPCFHDIQFNGNDYIIWYIEKDAPEAELVFVEP